MWYFAVLEHLTLQILGKIILGTFYRLRITVAWAPKWHKGRSQEDQKGPLTRDFDQIFPDIGKYFLGGTPDIMIVGHTWQPPLQPDLRRLIVKEFPTRMHFTWDCEYCEKTFLKRFFKESSQLRYQIFCYQPCNLIFMIVRERKRKRLWLKTKLICNLK